MIWKRPFTLQDLDRMRDNTMLSHIGIQFSEIGNDFLAATLSADARTVQPYRLLHGGASVALIETLGSVASVLCVPDASPDRSPDVVGIEVNANHLKGVREGETVTGICRPVRLGRTLHVWSVEIRNATGDLTCVGRLTVAIVPKGG